jgi:dihydrofolate reductase
MIESNTSSYPKVSLLMVMSVNGVVAQREVQNSFEWTSNEDRHQFLKKTREIGTALMGSNTYRSIGEKPYEGIQFHVMTHHPDNFAPHPRVTFHQGPVSGVLKGLAASGVKHVALLGGPKINAQCLDNQLVDEIYLTIEPLMMPEGMHLASDIGKRIALKLESLETLNETKTLLLNYQVVK